MKRPSRAIPPIIQPRPMTEAFVEHAVTILGEARRILDPSPSDPDVVRGDLDVHYEFQDHRITSCLVNHDLGGQSYSVGTGRILTISVPGAGFDEFRIQVRAVADREEAVMPNEAATVVTRAIAVLRRTITQKPHAAERVSRTTGRTLDALSAGINVSGVTEGTVSIETRRPNVAGRMDVKSPQALDAGRLEALREWALEAIPPQITVSHLTTPQGRDVVFIHARAVRDLAMGPVGILRNIVHLPEHLRS